MMGQADQHPSSTLSLRSENIYYGQENDHACR